MVSRDALDSMLYLWAAFKSKEVKDMGWPSVSIGGKLIEAARLGLFSHGTAQYANNFTVPKCINVIQTAMNELTLNHKQVIALEYTERGSQRIKAAKIRISVTQYRARLCRARNKLMRII